MVIKFTIVTDYQALVYLNMHKMVKPHITRWFEVFQEFYFEIKYRPVNHMAHVDAFSRVIAKTRDTNQSVDLELSQQLEVFVAMSPVNKV